MIIYFFLGNAIAAVFFTPRKRSDFRKFVKVKEFLANFSAKEATFFNSGLGRFNRAIKIKIIIWQDGTTLNIYH